MKKMEFDELQQSRRDRYGYQSFVLLMFLLLADDVLYSMGIVWAEHPVNTLILLLTGAAYFISRCIWGDAMIGPKEKPVGFTVRTVCLMLFAAAAAVLAGAAIYRNWEPSGPEKGGALLFPYCLLMWAVIAAVSVVKRIRGGKAGD